MRKTNLPLLSLIVFSAAFLFWQLGRNHLIEWDEGIYALVAKNILATGDWLTFTWQHGFPWFEKPPLYFWLTAPLIKILGTTSLAPRIWPALFGLGSVLATYFLGRKMFGERVGLVAGLILASTTGFLYYARSAMLDVPVTFFMTLSLYFFWRGRETQESKYWALFGIATALGTLTKGVVGMFPFAIAAIYAFIEILLDRSFKRYSLKNILLFSIFYLLSSVPWHLVMYQKHGQAFLENYLLYHVLLRSSSAIEGKSAPTFWFITVIKTQFRIWFIPLLPALAGSLRQILKKKREIIFLAIWAAVIFSVFTVSKSKLIWYIIPIYPVLSLLVAAFISWVVSSPPARWLRPPLQAILLPAVFLTALGYNLLMWERILPRDFSAEQVSLIETKNQIDPESKFLVAGLGYSLAAYYSDGPVESIQPHAATGLFDDKGWRFVMLPKETYREKGLENYPFAIRAEAGEFYLLSRTDL
jgi:4-amino-4-deoxy-L-arabinose transferase-like glycosyltransferase